MDRKGRFDLTDAEQAFNREGCTTSACHASVRVEYWQEWVKEFEIVFVNSFLKKIPRYRFFQFQILLKS